MRNNSRFFRFRFVSVISLLVMFLGNPRAASSWLPLFCLVFEVSSPRRNGTNIEKRCMWYVYRNNKHVLADTGYTLIFGIDTKMSKMLYRTQFLLKNKNTNVALLYSHCSSITVFSFLSPPTPYSITIPFFAF